MVIGFLRLLGALLSEAARPRSGRVQRRVRSSGPLPLALIHPSAWKWHSANFACRSFSEVCPIIGLTAHVFAPIRALDYLPCWNS